MKELRLYIYEEGGKFIEILELNSNSKSRLVLPYMSILTAFNKAIEKQPEDVHLKIESIFTDMFDEIVRSIKNTKEQNKLDMSDYLEVQLSCSNILPCNASLLGMNASRDLGLGYWENIAVNLASENWLSPPAKGSGKNKKTPFQKYEEFFKRGLSPLDYTDLYFTELSTSYLFPTPTYDFESGITSSNINASDHFNIAMYEICMNRYKQSQPLPFPKSFFQIDRKIYKIKKEVKPRLYTSNEGIMPLLWAEIFFALENDVYVKKCAVCNRYFPIQYAKHNQIYCGVICRNESKRRKSAEGREPKGGAQNGKKAR